MYKTRRKVIASLLVFILTMAHLSTLGEAIASSLEDQKTTTNIANIEFDVYFKKGNEKYYSSVETIGAENYIYASINVKNEGYLKDAKLELKNPNFEVSQELTTEQISKVDGNKIELNRIKAGKNIEIAIPISIIQGNNVISPNVFNKQSSVKLTGTYVDGDGKEKQVEKVMDVNLGWTAEAKAELDIKVIKCFDYYYVPQNNGGHGPGEPIPMDLEVIPSKAVQLSVKSYIKDNSLPVKENKIEITTPTIAGFRFSDVKVYSNTTKATNGDERGFDFAEENYTYNEETNKLTITIKNEIDQNGNVSWQKNAEDEFIVTYLYNNGEWASDTNIPIQANNQITVYKNVLETLEKNVQKEEIILGDSGNQVDFSIGAQKELINKGQIYANFDVKNKIETEYEQTITADVTVTDYVDEIILNQNVDKFLTQTEKPYDATQTYYKRVTIDANEVKRVLGESPEICFYNGTTQIAKIDKQVKANEEGKYVVDLSEFNINTLEIQTSKAKSQGKINFNIVKAIKGDIGYTKNEIKSFKNLKIDLDAKTQYEEKDVISKTINNSDITFVEPTTQAELVIENNNLSTVVLNKDVKFRAILKTDTLNCMLYENPTIDIVLPKYIENINIKNVEVLFGAEGTNLKLRKNGYNTELNPDGTRMLRIALEGKQTAYMLGAVSKGLNVLVTSDITLNQFTANMEDKITMFYGNMNELNNHQVKQTQANIKVVAPVGMVTTTTISNYVENAQPVTVINGETKTVAIDKFVNARNANFTMNVINNYNNTIDNISILGRIPFKANKDIETQKDLGTTMNMPLTSPISISNIDLSKVKIYYSENGEATKDLEKQANAWTLDIANLENVKSYLIVLTDVTMNTADNITFGYTAQIPENLNYNESAYQNYVVYFNNNLKEGTIQDKQIATSLGVSTGKGPILEASMSSNVSETQEMLTGDIIKYTLTVKNTGTEIANDVIATLATQKENEQGKAEIVLEIPEGLKYVEQDEENPENYNIKDTSGRVDINLGTIAPNQTITKEIYMQVDHLTQDTIVSNISAILTSSNAAQVQTNTLKNTLAKTYFITASTVLKDTEVLKEGQEFTYHMAVISSSIYETRQNSVVEIKLPEELVLQKVEIKEKENSNETDITDKTTYNYNEKQRKLTIELGEVTGRNSKIIYLKTKVGTLADNVYSKEINIETNVSEENGRKELIKFETVKVGKVGFKVTQNSNIPENATIAAYEDFKYIFKIQNLSDVDLYNVKFTDILPEELMLANIVATYESGNKITSNTNSISISMKGKETTTIEVNVRAKALDENKTIKNKATIEYEGTETVTSPTYTHIIEKFDSSGMDIPMDPSYAQKRIMGTVWIDNNKDGARDEEEEKLSNVEVMLFNNQTAQLVRDSEGNVLRQYTDKNGTYTFDKIPQGKYTVIFLYDSANYSATVYRKENVDTTLNSDAVDSMITLDGKARVAAITEEVAVNDSNIYNIDLGLISNPKFDLKLDKTVSKITVVDANGTKSYDYKDEKLAKKDLVGKQINDTTIIVEYKIKVTNEGAVAGYVKKIADYMPQEMKFSSELNRDWYTGDNGILFNSSLANTAINPGETKEVTLTLTKKMTENNLGLYHNEAEIYEAYNDLGLEDIDSKVANKASNEDDISSADVIITVKTGEMILFVGLSISILVTIGIGVYFIRKKIIV